MATWTRLRQWITKWLMNVHQVEQQVADELLEEGQEGAEDTGGEAREVEENSASGAIQKENDDSDDRVTEGKVGMLLAMIKADRHLLGRVERAVIWEEPWGTHGRRANGRPTSWAFEVATQLCAHVLQDIAFPFN